MKDLSDSLDLSAAVVISMVIHMPQQGVPELLHYMLLTLAIWWVIRRLAK